ncbi:MAG: hypothetical protein ACRYFS_23880 [Janthinobacterium lividum]
MDLPPVEPGDPEIAAFWLQFWRWAVAALQVIGGLFGLFNLMFATVTGTPGRFLFLLGFVLFVASVWGGILLALDKRAGIIVSLIIQLLQVFQLTIDSVVYSFFCGIQLVGGFQSTDTGTEFKMAYYWPSRFFVLTNPSPASLEGNFTGVNLVAVLAIICLMVVRSAHSRLPLPMPKTEPATENTWPPVPKA